MSTAAYKKSLLELFPTAKITTSTKKGTVDFEVKISPSISEKQYDAMFPKIKKIFGKKLVECYTEETGHHFHIYAKL